MSRTFGLPLWLAGLLALTGRSVSSQQQFPPGFVDPQPILDAAVQAIGNDKLNCVTLSGAAYNGAVGQARLSEKNVDWPRPDQLANYTRTMNWQAKTMKEEFDRKPGLTPAAWKYGIGWIDGPIQQHQHQVFMLNASGPKPFAWHMDGPNGQPVANEPDVAEVFPVELWMNPHGFLKAARMPGANPQATWRWELGEMGRDGPTTIPEKMYVVRITAPGGFKIDATINKEHMLQRMHTLVADPVLGDLNYEHEFTNDSYIDIGSGIKFPTGWHSHEGYDDNFNNQNISAGHNAFGGTMKDVKANVCADPVAVPDAIRNTQFPAQPTMTKLADGVFTFEIGHYKSVAVEFPSTITVFEAPRTEDFNLRVIDAIVKQIPNKPIRYVVNSHQHFDAAGGLRTYFHIGATVITQIKNWEFYNHDFINYAARTVKPDMVTMWPPTELAEGYYYETVRENYTIEEAGRVMRIYYVNPLQHAEGMLMAYLPKEKILIESDIVNTNNPLPAIPTRDMQSLFTEVTRLKLDVEQIVPIHGKPIPWGDFAKLFSQPPRQAASAATLASPPSFAQAPLGGGTVAFTDVRIIDGTGRAPIERGTLVVGGGRVTAVGPARSTTIPAGAQRIDATGKTIVPGFINAHAHVNVDRGATLPVSDDLVRRLKTYALYGVTSTVSLGSTPADELEGFKLMQDQDRAGLDRARLYTAGLNAVGKTPEEARASVDRLADLKAHIIKFHINGNPNDMNEATWGAIIDESHKKGLKVAVHIFYQKDAKAALDHGVDIIAHGIRDMDVSPEVVAEMKQKNAGYIPTLVRDVAVFVYESTPDFLKDPFFQRGMPLYQEQLPTVTTPEWQDKVRKDPTAQMTKKALVQGEHNLKTLSDAGITIAMGSDSGVASNPGRWQGYFEQVEMEMMNKAGMSPMKVIVASTGDAARLMGLKQVGSLVPGNWADLVVLRANPLDSIRNTRAIDSVWIAGRKLTDVKPVTDTK